MPSGLRGFDDAIAHRADSLDFSLHDIARPQELGGRAAEADTFGCAGGDDVAGLDGESLREPFDGDVEAEDHVGGRAVLLDDAVDARGQAAVKRIAVLV